jgi:SAM-dependent MidA family methyltransferase
LTLGGAAAALLLLCGVSILTAQSTTDRPLRNAWEVHRELTVPVNAREALRDFFPSFMEYHDLVMFHPRVGYYAIGRVDFVGHYRTYPVVLAPRFGHMVAEQVFFMWQGMRRAGTLDAGERFTIAEFGAGDGALAESILDYVEQKAAQDASWRQFADQVLYVCYDRSPALNRTQRERNARFGRRFDARVADATNLTATIAPGSLKGVVLSNELPDAFSVHKIILSPDGAAEVAFVVPSLPGGTWDVIRPLLPAAAAGAIAADDAAVERRFFEGRANPDVYLTRASFVTLLEHLLATDVYEPSVNALQFREAYAPASLVPEVAAHLARYAAVYADVLARESTGFVSYINPGAERFVHGASEVLRAGYVLTIDYGGTWEEMLAQHSYPHFRTYGPVENEGLQLAPNGIDTSAPYSGPTLNDFTTDVNFSLLAVEGEAVALRPLFYGSQAALQAGTGVSLDDVPPEREREGNAEEFREWAKTFGEPGVYKMLLQQKTGTDGAYRFPARNPEPLGLDRSRLSSDGLRRAAVVEQRLREGR